MTYKLFWNTSELDSSDAATNANTWIGFTFTPIAGISIASVKMYLHKAGTPGTLTFGILPTTAGLPVGAVPDALVASGTFDTSVLGDFSASAWHELILSAPYALTANTMYAFVIGIAVSTSSNDVYAGYSANNYTGGARVRTTDAGSTWTSYTSLDALFEIWGTPNGKVYPSDAFTRITGLVHRYSPGNYTLEVFLGDTKTDWPVMKPELEKSEPALEPKVKEEPIIGPPAPSDISSMRSGEDISKHIPNMTPNYLNVLGQSTVKGINNPTPLTPTTANVLAHRSLDIQSLELQQGQALGAGVTTDALTNIKTNQIIASLGGRIAAEKQRLAKAKQTQKKQKNWWEF